MGKTISIEEFAERNNVKVSTVKSRYNEIPGITKEGSTYIIQNWARYPFPMKCKTKTSLDKSYAVLKAISQYKYIDSKMLDIPEESFEFILNDLTKRKLIAKNGTRCKFGANGYDCTLLGGEQVQKRREEVIKFLAMTAIDCAAKLALEASANHF